MNNNYLRVDPNKLIFLLTLLCCSQSRSDLFSEASNVDRWKCFSCWCRTLRKMNIYTEAHLGVLHYAAESQKCNQLILLPSSVSPNSSSINSPLKPKYTSFFRRCVYAIRPARASQVRKPFTFTLPWKKILWRGPIHAWLCVSKGEPMWSVEIRSLSFIRRHKCWAEWKGNWSAYWSH